jgi:hypothetical protein
LTWYDTKYYKNTHQVLGREESELGSLNSALLNNTVTEEKQQAKKGVEEVKINGKETRQRGQPKETHVLLQYKSVTTKRA